ncbi:lytic murein transglycosylase family protein [endosymbiont of Acanthamoeba sp. UWC8]|uniref:lytic transglycosylase domain-containing protein n=1 Tax=endosymbiont of Acanthamoeba sp. UWC8 TaxID=86106 RepID=UPI0004D12C7E|nr:lytic transglycosylase domain-containing protein [endosymbiont of Acanthamoeba sp. UWC8]AIF81916.1 lytic murein transglycosylase family protein [endosymbiont of Acanthamoeba sp. UWC8]
MYKLLGFLSAFLLCSFTANAANINDQQITLALKYAKTNDWEKAYSLAQASSSPKLANSLVKFKELLSGKYPLSSLITFHDENPWFPVCRFQDDIERKIGISSTLQSIISWHKLCPAKHESARFLENYATSSLNNTIPSSKFFEHWAKISNLNPLIDQQIFDVYRKQIPSSLITRKIQNFMWQGNYEQAIYYSKFISPREQMLTKVKVSYANNLSGYEMLVKRYPKLKNDEYIKFRHIRKLLKEKQDAEAYNEFASIKHFSNPEQWWKARHTIIRNFIREKQYKRAYKIAVHHGTKTGDEFQEAEWISGWVALKFLNTPKAAANHFYNSYMDCQYASCKSRAAYWLAKSYEKLNDKPKMEAWYDTAAKHKMHFYGILAITEHPKSLDKKFFDYLSEKKPAQQNIITPEIENLVASTYYMSESGNNHIARILSKYIADSDLDPKIKHLVAEHLKDRKILPLRIQYAKFLSNHKGPFLECGYPTDIHISNNKNSKSLYLAIIRQESNFDQSAKSPAGAIGLMQLIPSTAKRCAKTLGLHHNAFRTDPKANVAKGVNYLDGLVEYFGNIAPAIAAYNAGEKAVERWIREFGDPATMRSVSEVLDWIESIPYAETRTYVKKVLENMVVYESILQPDQPQFLASLLGK